MNWVDVVILGGIVFLAFAGLLSGFLMPASGIAGLGLGVILAVQHHDSLAFILAEHVEGETVRRIAAFVVIVLTTTIAIRLSASVVKRILSYLVLGWIDRVAGALAGAALAVVVFGTAAYVLDGVDIPQVRETFGDSSLVKPISHVSFIKTSSPWCSTQQESAPGEECTDLFSLAEELFGGLVSDRVTDLLGHDAGTLADVVKTSLTGSPQEMTSLAEQQAARGSTPEPPDEPANDDRPDPRQAGPDRPAE